LRKESVWRGASSAGLGKSNFLNMPEFKFLSQFSNIQNGMLKSKNEQTACSILNSMLKIQQFTVADAARRAADTALITSMSLMSRDMSRNSDEAWACAIYINLFSGSLHNCRYHTHIHTCARANTHTHTGAHTRARTHTHTHTSCPLAGWRRIGCLILSHL
jgi:hypothetical protein